MQYKNSKFVIILPLVIAVSVLTGMVLNRVLYPYGVNKVPAIAAKNQARTNIGEVMDMISRSYVDSVNVDSLEEEAIYHLIKDLDPHTVYIPADEMQAANEDMVGNFGGVGIQFYMYRDSVTVVDVVKGGPSAAAGICGGDRVIMVDDSVVSGVGKNSTDIMKQMRGEVGTKVRLTLYRRSVSDTIVRTITRNSIPLNSVEVAYMLDDSTGIIRVSHFGMQTYNEFMLGIARLAKQGMRKLVVDMRDNEGGILSIALRMVNEFLPGNRLMLYTQGNHFPKADYFSNGKGRLKDIPVAVLINEGSASAAEIFAGALQDNDRAMIIGRRSFGKGLVQEQLDLPDGSALRLTIARYYIPSGRCIQKPYKLGEEGKEDYYKELWTRMKHGEFYQADSIKFDESQRYSTIGGRTVYGGGGIMPDIFVPADTTNYTKYLQKLIMGQHIYHYTFDFLDKYREDMMKTVTDWKGVKAYLKDYNLVEEVAAYASKAEKNPLPRNNAQIRESSHIIRIMTESYIARHLFDNDGFFPIYEEIDNVLEVVKKKF